jgi:hypothetical protein
MRILNHTHRIPNKEHQPPVPSTMCALLVSSEFHVEYLARYTAKNLPVSRGNCIRQKFRIFKDTFFIYRMHLELLHVCQCRNRAGPSVFYFEHGVR